jgi:hypothetical protein
VLGLGLVLGLVFGPSLGKPPQYFRNSPGGQKLHASSSP